MWWVNINPYTGPVRAVIQSTQHVTTQGEPERSRSALTHRQIPHPIPNCFARPLRVNLHSVDPRNLLITSDDNTRSFPNACGCSSTPHGVWRLLLGYLRPSRPIGSFERERGPFDSIISPLLLSIQPRRLHFDVCLNVGVLYMWALPIIAFSLVLS